jgi:hypothetical protein
MQKQNKIFLSILIMVIGFVLNGLAWTVAMGPTLNTLALLLGLGFMFGGFIYLILSIKS